MFPASWRLRYRRQIRSLFGRCRLARKELEAMDSARVRDDWPLNLSLKNNSATIDLARAVG